MMKRILLCLMGLFLTGGSLHVNARENDEKPSYRTFISSKISLAMAGEIMGYINTALSGFYAEYVREDWIKQTIEDERAFMSFLEKEGLLNTRAPLRPMGWNEVSLVIYINREHTVQISIVPLSTGVQYRVPVQSEKPHVIAKAIALQMAELLEGGDLQKQAKRKAAAYFGKFTNTRTVDIAYGGLIASAGGVYYAPLAGSVSVNFPLRNQVFGFSLRISGVYLPDDHEPSPGTSWFACGIGMILQKPLSRITPTFSLYAGYAGKTQSPDYFTGGPFLEPHAGVSLFLGTGFKLFLDGSLQISYRQGLLAADAMLEAGVGIGF
jgi:hypothetical protein